MTLPLQINRDGQLETIEVKIPPGVKDGSRIRIKGRGQHSNGEPGDLFIVTRIEPHGYFRRENLDIYIDAPISIYEALLGTKLDVPTLDGPVTVTIPPARLGSEAPQEADQRQRRGTAQRKKATNLWWSKSSFPRIWTMSHKKLIEKLAAKHPLFPRDNVGW